MTINNSDIEMCTIHHYLSRFIIIHHDSSWFIFGLVYPEAYTARRKELFHYGSEDLGDGLWCECQNRIVIHISSWWLVCHWIGVLGEFNRKPFYVIGKKTFSLFLWTCYSHQEIMEKSFWLAHLVLNFDEHPMHLGKNKHGLYHIIIIIQHSGFSQIPSP